MKNFSDCVLRLLHFRSFRQILWEQRFCTPWPESMSAVWTDSWCTIAQILAPVAKKVIGVEIVEEAVEAAKINAAENGLTNCEFIAGDVLKVLDTITERPDTIILDPPRDGIHPKAIRQMVGYGVERMVYISCKPTSLARDLPAFLMAGYCVERVKCVDMFPFTSGVETVCLLRRKKNH